jgi:hypothetical protein
MSSAVLFSSSALRYASRQALGDRRMHVLEAFSAGRVNREARTINRESTNQALLSKPFYTWDGVGIQSEMQASSSCHCAPANRYVTARALPPCPVEQLPPCSDVHAATAGKEQPRHHQEGAHDHRPRQPQAWAAFCWVLPAKGQHCPQACSSRQVPAGLGLPLPPAVLTDDHVHAVQSAHSLLRGPPPGWHDQLWCLVAHCHIVWLAGGRLLATHTPARPSHVNSHQRIAPPHPAHTPLVNLQC